MKRVVFFIIICIFLSGCTAPAKTEKTLFAMDTVMNLQIWGPDGEEATASIARMLQSLEETWSATKENSVIAKLNQGTEALTAQQQTVLDRVEQLYVRTGGAFHPRLGELSRIWGFYNGTNLEEDFFLPTREQTDAAIQKETWDLGAVIKGYAGDLAVELLKEKHMDCAILNFGGNVQTFGTKSNGDPWRIGIQNPKGGDNLGVVCVDGTCAVVTSGDYQRYFEWEGVRYHHILDPETGCPADSGLSSVTVICRDGMTADALSTALFVMGLERASEFWRQSDDFEAVFLLTDGTVYATEGAGLSGCEYEVISREK